jgi:3-oxoadipate enol-lactonase
VHASFGGLRREVRVVHITVEGVRLNVICTGSGAPVVLLHGFPFSHHIWDAQIETLARTSRVIAPDLRGMGESGAPPGPYLMENLASDVAGILDALEVERASIAGHSMGGYVALAFFRMFAERVSSLALVCSRVEADDPQTAQARMRLADRLEREGMQPALDAYLPRVLAPGAPAQTVAAAAGIMRAQNARGAAAMLRGAALRASSEDLLDELTLPVLLVCGSQDSISPPPVNRVLAARLARARVEVIQRSAHLPMLEAPPGLDAALQVFLSGS